MQRDMDLIRQLLLGIEQSLPGNHHSFAADGFDDAEIWYNVHLLVEAQFIRGVTVRWGADGTGPFVYQGGLLALTWDGHDFLDAIRDDDVWQKTKKKVQADGLNMQSLTVDVVKTLCVSAIKQMVGL